MVRFVLGKVPGPGRPTNMDNSRARVYSACRRFGRGLFSHFFSYIIFLLFLPLSGRLPDIDCWQSLGWSGSAIFVG